MEKGKKNVSGFQSAYKQKGIDVDKRTLRAHRRSIERKNTRHEDLVKRRNIGNLSPLKEVHNIKEEGNQKTENKSTGNLPVKVIEKLVNRRDKLQKWREEKMLKKKVEMMERGKKLVFRVGQVGHQTAVAIPSLPDLPKVNKKSQPAPVAPRRSSRLSSQGNAAVKTSNQSNATVKSSNQSNVATKRSSSVTRSNMNVSSKTKAAGKTSDAPSSTSKVKDAVTAVSTRTRPASGPAGQRVTRQSARNLQFPDKHSREPMKAVHGLVKPVKADHGIVKSRHNSKPSAASGSKESSARSAHGDAKPEEVNAGKVTRERGNQLSSFAPVDFTFQAPAHLTAFDFKPLSPASAASFLFPGEEGSSYMGRCSTPKEDASAQKETNLPSERSSDSDEQGPGGEVTPVQEGSGGKEPAVSATRRRKSQRMKHKQEEEVAAQSTDTGTSGSDQEPEIKRSRETPGEKTMNHHGAGRRRSRRTNSQVPSESETKLDLVASTSESEIKLDLVASTSEPASSISDPTDAVGEAGNKQATDSAVTSGEENEKHGDGHVRRRSSRRAQNSDSAEPESSSHPAADKMTSTPAEAVKSSEKIGSATRSVQFKTPTEPLSKRPNRRRTVATASGCGRRTPKSASKASRLSMSLRLLSPEESVEFLSKSPMIEMSRRTPKQRTPGGAPLNPLPTFDDLDLPPLKLNFHEEGDAPERKTDSSEIENKTQTIVKEEENEEKQQRVSADSTANTDSSAPDTGDEHDVPYFRNLLKTQTECLNQLSAKWEDIMTASKGLSEEVQGQIRTTIGQAQLLIAQRFKQFSGLVDKCEFNIIEEGEAATRCSDLQGFWDMVYYQVEDVNNKFSKLDKLQENNWKTEAPQIVKKKVLVKKKTTTTQKQPDASSKPKVKSQFAEFRAKMKQQQQQSQSALKADQSAVSEGVPEGQSAEQTVNSDITAAQSDILTDRQQPRETEMSVDTAAEQVVSKVDTDSDQPLVQSDVISRKEEAVKVFDLGFFTVKSPVRSPTVKSASPKLLERRRSSVAPARSSPFLKAVLEKSVKRKSLGLLHPGMQTTPMSGERSKYATLSSNAGASPALSTPKSWSLTSGGQTGNQMDTTDSTKTHSTCGSEPVSRDMTPQAEAEHQIDNSENTASMREPPIIQNQEMQDSDSSKENVNPENSHKVESSTEEHDVPYFRSLLITETDKLNSSADEWDTVSRNTQGLSEEVEGQIRTTIGQAHLLIAQRFKQFSGLVDRCEFNIIKEGEAATRCSDLQGFWDMIYYQVEDVHAKFHQLQKLKENNWKIEKPAVPKKMKKKPCSVKATVKPAVKSRFAEFRAHLKKQRTQSPEANKAESTANKNVPQGESESSEANETMTFDAGFFAVRSPVKHVSSPQISSPKPAEKTLQLPRIRTPSSPFLKAVLDRSVRKKSPGLLSPKIQRTTPGDINKSIPLTDSDNMNRISPLVHDITPSVEPQTLKSKQKTIAQSEESKATPLAEPKRRSTRHSIQSLQEKPFAMSPTTAVTKQLQTTSIFTPESTNKSKLTSASTSARKAGVTIRDDSSGDAGMEVTRNEGGGDAGMEVCEDSDPLARLLIPASVPEESMDVDLNAQSPDEAEMPTQTKRDLVGAFNKVKKTPVNRRRSRRSVHFLQEENSDNITSLLPFTPYNRNSLVPQQRRKSVRKSECLLLFTPPTENASIKDKKVTDFLSPKDGATVSEPVAACAVVDNLISLSPNVPEDSTKTDCDNKAAADLLRNNPAVGTFSPLRRSSRLSSVNGGSLL